MALFNKETVTELYSSKNNELAIYLNDIQNIVINTKSLLEGNAFYIHNSLLLYPELLPKQLNLFGCGLNAKTRICEIGFNAGHSTLLMLLGRDKTPLDFTIFDIGYHSYTKPSLDYISEKFPHINFEYFEGNSITEVPKYIKANPSIVEQYDIVHVDGGHTQDCILNDMKNADRLVGINGVIIIDDTNVDFIDSCVNKYIFTGRYKEVDIYKTQGYQHRIIRKI